MITKHFLPQFVFNFAMPAAPVTGAGDGGGAPAAPAGGTGGGTGGGGAAPPAIDWKTAPEQFRSGYEKLKSDFEKLTKDHEPWQNWSKESGVNVDQLGNVHGTYQEITETLGNLGEQLGFAEDEISEAIEKHGVAKVLNHLMNRAAAGDQPGAGDGGEGDDLESRIQQAIDSRMAPIQQKENDRLTDAANSRFEQIVHSSIVDSYKAEGIDVANIPKEESFMLMNGTSELLKYDEKALVALKNGKGQAEIQKAFQTMKTYLDQYYLARSGRERGKILPGGGQRPGGNGAPPKKATLDEMIEEPTLINQKYKPGT